MMDAAFTHDPSNTAAFKAISDLDPIKKATDALRAVVIGGGTGAPVSIRTLLSMGIDTSAVVAMADDGGSTGILRKEIDATPPGDVRKCLAAFARNPEDPLTKAFKYRLEFAQNHTLGNLVISALEDATGSFPEAISICERLLDAQGHVYPSTLDRVTLCAQTRDGQWLEGQANACVSEVALDTVGFEQPALCRPYGPALQAIREADLIVLGPGSLFTSIIPNLLVPGVIDAIRDSRGITLFVCSLADMQGETRGLSAAEHVDALMRHGMEGLLDYVLLHTPDSLRELQVRSQDPTRNSRAFIREEKTRFVQTEKGMKSIHPVVVTFEDIQVIQASGAVVLLRDLVDPTRPTWHDPQSLREALTGVMELCHLPQM